MAETVFNNINPAMMERIKSLRLIDDELMTVVFSGDKKATELLIRILLNRNDLRVTKSMTQEQKHNLFGRSVTLDIVAEGQNEKISVEIVGNTDLQDGENTITVLVKNSETNKNSTYQIIANKKEQKAVNPQVEKGNNIRLILAGLFAVVVIAIILTFIIMKKKQNDDDIEMEEPRAKIKNQRKYNLEENDEDEEERINLDDEKELFKRVNKSDFKSVENRQIPQNRPSRSTNLERNTTRRPENLQNNNIRRRENNESNESRKPRALDDYFNNPNNQKGRHF